MEKIKHFRAVSRGFPFKKPYSHNILLKKDGKNYVQYRKSLCNSYGKAGRIIDARNRYEWKEVAKITLPENESDAEIEVAYNAANIPAEALCVAVKMIEA